MALPGNKNFSDYDNYVTDPNPTTSAQAQDFFLNQAELLKAVIDCDFWQPETVYQPGDVVKSDSMPNGTEAVMVATKASVTSNVEPSWGEVGGANISDGACFWKLRWVHWSKDVEEITDLTTGATNRLPNTSYAVGNVIYSRSNLSVALKCTTAGTTSNTELDISTVSVGESVEDGSVVWSVVKRDLTSDFEDLEINLLPVGTSIMYMADTVPEGFLDESGAEVSRTTYARLFAVIGTKYGSGDGSTTFNLPNKNNGSFAEGSNTAGTIKSAGLPNASGKMAWMFGGSSETDERSGAFANTRFLNAKGQFTNGSGLGPWDVYLDLSKSNAIYGNSDTVQPKSVTVKFCIKY